jgi:DNA polymerase
MSRWTKDFETRSRSELKTAGLYNYSLDPSTDWLCCALKREDGPTQVIYNPAIADELGVESSFDAAILANVLAEEIKSGTAIIHSHNAEFEAAISRAKNIFNVPLTHRRCSAAMAAAMGIPASLSGAAIALGTEIQKDEEGRKLMLNMCKPDKSGNWVIDAQMLQRLGEYCKVDVDTEYAIEQLLQPLSESEQRTWEVMIEMNFRGILCDTDRCKKAIEIINSCKEDADKAIVELTEGRVRTGNQVAALLRELSLEGCIPENLRSKTIAELDPSYISERAKRLLEARQDVSMASVKKYYSMLGLASPTDSRIRGMFRYHGAATGRFSAQGIQPQNLYRPSTKHIQPILDALDLGDPEFFKSVFLNPMESCANVIRSMLIAAPGQTFINGDYNAIEARVLLWLAGDPEIEDFRNGVDLYKKQASAIYNVPAEDVKDDQRQLGKVCILGCGYGMSGAKFKVSCEGYGIHISDDLATKAVSAFRETHPAVVKFWYALERAAMDAVRHPGTVHKVGLLTLSKRSHWLMIKLPSGRKIYYFKPFVARVETKLGLKDALHYTACKGQSSFTDTTYGAALVENVCQGAARDVLAAAMDNLANAGLNQVLMVHDELMCEVPALDDMEPVIQRFKKCMELIPSWADGLPLKVGAWCGNMYKK